MAFQNKIYQDIESLEKQVRTWQSQGDKVIFTNGVFDLLHLGHLNYLSEAKELGNRLIIAVNSDSSVKRLKGNERPINNEKMRSSLLATMEMVDGVIIFTNDTPLSVIKKILPDVLVKGGDYKVIDIVGYQEVIENGGEVKTLTYVEGFSTTDIIDKIKNTHE